MQKILTQTDKKLVRNSLVSMYIRLARIQQIGEADIEIIDTMLGSILGSTILPQELQVLNENLLSFRQASNIIKKFFSLPDKIKLLLNFFSIVYSGEYLQMLGSLEIIKFVDFLGIDVNLYDRILDMLEGNRDYIETSPTLFFEDRKLGFIKNFMCWGIRDDMDAFYRTNHNEDYIAFLMIEEMLLVGCQGNHDIFLQGNTGKEPIAIEENRMYLFRSDQQLLLHEELALRAEDVRNIFEIAKENSTRAAQYRDSKLIFDIFYKGAGFAVKIEKGNLEVNEQSVRDYKQIALNDKLRLDTEFYGADVLLGHKRLTSGRFESQTQYLEKTRNFFRLNTIKTPDAILQLDLDSGIYFVTPLGSGILINHRELSKQQPFELNRDILCIGEKNIKINRHLDILDVPYDIKELNVVDMYHEFDQGQTIALDHVSFQVKKGEILVIVGPSGSGKTTLLKTIVGEIVPLKAKVDLDGTDLYRNFSSFQKYIGYVPQDDLLFENLTVYENLYYCARLRLPHIKEKTDIQRRIDNILKQTGLYEKRNLRVGNVMNKTLSGGQRKRLNIALELLADPLILILDEPTSGLSSKDSEKLVDMLTELKEQGKLILATIHQPNPDLFQKFDRLLFLDKGGVQVYFGDIANVFEYFNHELNRVVIDNQRLMAKKKLKMPEYIFDILEYSGETRQSVAAGGVTGEPESTRTFSPEYWKKRYQKHNLLQIIQANTTQHQSGNLDNFKPALRRMMPKEHLLQSYYLFSRNLKDKITNRVNLFFTFIAAPMLSLLVSMLLRNSTNEGGYQFGMNENISIFIFISVIIALFLGLSNSVNEILGEKRIFLREKKLNIRTLYFLLSKNITLTIFTVLQCVLYVLIAVVILEIRGLTLIYMGYLIPAGMSGYSIGPLASAFISDRSAVINILPTVLIPQVT
ncbi:MAG: ABC transporter ATP-binding protein, partial [Candidatus Cloacimonetes bacterium]|nr:ABC transporter ATP-binding protein [Candidatus Cloacimonadota bacterium]